MKELYGRTPELPPIRRHVVVGGNVALGVWGVGKIPVGFWCLGMFEVLPRKETCWIFWESHVKALARKASWAKFQTLKLSPAAYQCDGKVGPVLTNDLCFKITNKGT